MDEKQKTAYYLDHLILQLRENGKEWDEIKNFTNRVGMPESLRQEFFTAVNKLEAFHSTKDKQNLLKRCVFH